MSPLDLPPLPPTQEPVLSAPLIARRRRRHLEVSRGQLMTLALQRRPGRIATAGLLALLGLASVVTPWAAYASDARAQRDEIEATAAVMRQWVTGDTGGPTRHRIYYTFALPDGTTSEGEGTVTQESFASLTLGDSVRVLYDPDRPEESYLLEGGSDDRGPRSAGSAAVISLLGALLAGFGGLTLWRSLVRPTGRWQRLLQDGGEAEGWVVGVESDDDLSKARLRYRYSDRLGNEHFGTTEWVPRAVAEGWKAEDPGIVRYGKENLDESIWLGRGNLAFLR